MAGPQEAPSGPVGGQPCQGCWAGRLPRGVVTASGAAVSCPSQHPLTPQRPSFVPASPGTSTVQRRLRGTWKATWAAFHQCRPYLSQHCRRARPWTVRVAARGNPPVLPTWTLKPPSILTSSFPRIRLLLSQPYRTPLIAIGGAAPSSQIPPPSDLLSPSSFTDTRYKASAGQLPPATM